MKYIFLAWFYKKGETLHLVAHIYVQKANVAVLQRYSVLLCMYIVLLYMPPVAFK